MSTSESWTWWLSSAFVAVTLGIAGCGNDSDGPPPDEVRHPVTTTVHELQAGFDDGNAAEICAGITDYAARQAGSIAHGDPTTCERDVAKVIGMIDDGGGWDDGDPPWVGRVDPGGRKLTATVVGGDSWKAALPFVRGSGGKWRLDGFFGATPRERDLYAARAIDAPYPSARGRAVGARTDTGEPCSPVSIARAPSGANECVIAVKTANVPIRILTPFGGFKFSDCPVEYEVAVDAQGRTTTDDMQMRGPADTGCWDVNQCVKPNTNDFQAWKGRLRRSEDGALLHEMDVCLRTCVGNFTGRLAMRMTPTGDGWKVSPTRVGTTGFLIDGPLTARPSEGGVTFQDRDA